MNFVVLTALGVGVAGIGLATAALAQVADPGSIPTVISAGESDPRAPAEWRWSVGLGLAVVPDYEGSEDYTAALFPAVRAQKGQVYGDLFGLHFRSNVIDHTNWRFGPSANFRRGYSDVSNRRVDDLNNRESSFELGFEGGYDIPFGASAIMLRTEFLHDVSGGHNGFVVTPNVTYSTPLAPAWRMLLRGQFSIASDDYMSHYFTVSRSDARDSGLSRFDADADVKDMALGIAFNYNVTPSWKLTLLGQYKRMLGDAADSPVVDDEGNPNNVAAGVVLSYAW